MPRKAKPKSSFGPSDLENDAKRKRLSRYKNKLDEINDVVHGLEGKVSSFEGDEDDTEYKLLEGQLTKNL